MQMKYREHQILEQLLLKTTIKGNELSLLLGVSDRTIRNDIRNLNRILSSKEIKVSSNNLVGYYLEIPEEERKNLEIFLRKERLIAIGEPEYREKHIMMKLIKENTLDLNDVADEVFMSLGSLLIDLKRIELKLHQIDTSFNLDKKNSFVSIENCDERHIRLYFSLLLINKFGPFDEDVITQMVDERVSFEEFKKKIYTILNKYNVVLSNHDLLYFYTYIIVTIFRSRNGYKIGPMVFEERSSRNNKIIEEVASLVKEKTGETFNQDDKLLLVELYSSFNTLKSENEVNYILMDQIEKILVKLDDLYGTKVACDINFLLNFTLHLDSYINKSLLNIHFSEGIIKEVKHIYPFAYNLSNCFVDLYLKERGNNQAISDYEKALIAVHFQTSLERRYLNNKVKALLVCSYGAGTTKLLQVQLEKEVESLEIVESVSSVAFEIMDLEGIELIITTVPLKTAMGLPLVKVEVPLDSTSIEAIKAMIHSKGYINKGIYPLIIEMPKDVHTVNQSFEFISAFIIDYEKKEFEITEKFKLREKLVTTNLGKGIAMPHALFEGKSQYNLYLFSHKEGIEWGESKVHMVAAMLVNQQIQDYLNEYMKFIIDVYENIDVKDMQFKTVAQLIESLPR